MQTVEVFNFVYQLVTEPLHPRELGDFNKVKELFIDDMLEFKVGKYQSWYYGDIVVEFDVLREHYVTNIIIKSCDHY